MLSYKICNFCFLYFLTIFISAEYKKNCGISLNFAEYFFNVISIQILFLFIKFTKYYYIGWQQLIEPTILLYLIFV